jgi:RecA/RadA recombinase
VTAADALDDLDGNPSKFVSTGHAELDTLLRDLSSNSPTDGDARNGGIPRGQVTEIWGPPGSGKTALG